MSTLRTPLRSTLVLPVLTLAAAWSALWSWRGFTTTPAGYLGPLLVIGAAIALTGAVLRWRRVPGVLVVLAQLIIALVIASLVVTGSPVPGRPLYTALSDAIDSANTYAPPVPDHDGLSVHPLLILSGLGLMFLVDLVAVTWRRVSLAGLVLLAVYSVPVSLLGHGLPWWVFVVSAALFLGMLYVQEQSEVDRWGRSLSPRGRALRRTPGADRSGRTSSLRLRAGATAALAVVVAAVLPAALPRHPLDLSGFGSGPGSGSSISIDNPMVDVHRDLTEGTDIPLVRVTTDDPDPAYLRISVLNRFSGTEWSSGDRSVPADHLPDGAMPPLQGVDPAIPTRHYHYRISADRQFQSTWLPTQAPISSIEAAGDWRYDTSTMDFIAADDGLTTAGLTYSMDAVQLDLTASRLDRDSLTPPSGISKELTSLPAGLPPIVASLATSVTARASTPFEKAVALQAFFRNPNNGFVYSLDNRLGDSSGDLGTFLDPDKGRIGYCQQYATAMAAMARALGIPARVAVGFLRPAPIAPHTFEYSSRDLHAWPELYFSGAGWVRFDPTPAIRVPSPPTYTTQGVGTPPVRHQQPTPRITPKVTQRPGSKATNDGKAKATPDQTKARHAAGRGGSSFPWAVTGVGLGLVVLVAAGALGPGLVRRRRRRRRLRGGAEDVWDELRDTTIDLGAPWPASRTPREAHLRLAGLFGSAGDVAFRPARGAEQDPAAAAALGRIVRELELARYARTHATTAPGSWHDDAALCLSALEAGAGPRARRRARWWPASVLPRSTRGSGATAPDPLGGGVVVERI